jgi:hypothetical protein
MRAVVLEALAVAVVAGLVFQSLRHWVGAHYVVPSNSMEPTLHGDGARGDHVFVDKLASARGLARYDLAIFHAHDADLVKRVVAFGDDPERCWVELRDGDLWLGADATRLERAVKDPLDHRDMRVDWLRWPGGGSVDGCLAVPAGEPLSLHPVGSLDAARRSGHDDVRRALFAGNGRDADFGAWLSTVAAVDATYLDAEGRRGTEAAGMAVLDVGIDFECTLGAAQGVLCGVDLGSEAWMFHWDRAHGTVELWRNGETVASRALGAAATAGRVRIEYGHLDGHLFFCVDAQREWLWTVPRKPEWVRRDPGPSPSPLPVNRLCLALAGGAPVPLERLSVFHDVHWFRQPLEVGADPARFRPSKLVPPGHVWLRQCGRFARQSHVRPRGAARLRRAPARRAGAVAAAAVAAAVSERPTDDGGAPAPATVLWSAAFVYAAMTGGAWLWLHLRDRTGALAATALGEHGLWTAAGVGAAAGLLGAWSLSAVARRNGPVRSCEQRLARFIGAQSDRAALLLSLVSAIAEELTFRLAVQDALGPIAAVALYAALNTGPGFWPWLPVAVIAGALFSTLVVLGFGLLSATIAHALINYLTLRRILP